jgi:hypothetical protein
MKEIRICKRCSDIAGELVYKPIDKFSREYKGIQDGRKKYRFCRNCKDCEELRYKLIFANITKPKSKRVVLHDDFISSGISAGWGFRV